MIAMLRAVIAICLLASLADAAPKYSRPPTTATDRDLIAAEKAWIAAAAEKDRAKQTLAWEAAATAFMGVVDAGKVPKAVQQEAVYAAILAWKNALDVDPRVNAADVDQDHHRIPTPQPLDAGAQALIHAVDVYLTFSPPADEAASAKFLRASVLRRRHHLDKAIAGFLDIYEHHRDHEVAEYAANMTLDAYNRLQRYDKLIAFAAKLYADKKFLANKPDLAQVVRNIHTVAVHKDTDARMRAARESGDLSVFDRCGEQYLSILEDPGVDKQEAEELRYSAAVCFQQAGSIARAVAMYRELIKTSPSSRLAWRVIARIGVSEAQVGHYREAAEALEEYVERFPGEKDALAAGSDAVRYAVVSGDLARAAHIADLVMKNYGAKRPQLVAEATLAVLDAQLAAGKHKEATARARGAGKNALQRLRDPALALHAGRAFAAAACPVALVDDRQGAPRAVARTRGASVADELCPKSRDRALVAAARVQLALAGDRGAPDHQPAADSAPLADHATRFALDLDLEAVLAIRAPGPSMAPRAGGTTITLAAAPPAAAALIRGFERLIVDARTADVRIAARARLGTLHRHLGDRDNALLALRACVTDARATLAGSEWLARCERDLTALGEPDLEMLPELLPPPIASPVIAVEQPRYGTAQVPR